MMCYRDMTFCSFWRDCDSGAACSRALTDEIKTNARLWWGAENAPIAQFAAFPECFAWKGER